MKAIKDDVQTARRCRPGVEALEDRTAPALVASQFALSLPNPPLLETANVSTLLNRAAAATASDDAIIAVVDRGGNILGVRVEAGVSAAIQGNAAALTFAVDGAVAKARTAAFFASAAAPLTPRTIQFISQSTVTQREVEANPNDPNPASTLRGPGYIAPVGLGGHFPPRVSFTPQVDLFGIEHTNRDSTPPAAGFNRFNITFLAGDQMLSTPVSYGTASGLFPGAQNRGIATLPGGIPIYESYLGQPVLVGGIGVFFPGATGFATEENSSLSATFNPAKFDRTLEAEFMALAAVGGSDAFPVGALGGVPPDPEVRPLPSNVRIDLVGITLDVVGPGGDQGPQNLVDYAFRTLGVGLGNPFGGTNVPVDTAANQFINGQPVPEGWIVNPRNGANLTAAEVRQIIEQGINAASMVRAQIRFPAELSTRMVFAVADSDGSILGLYRMPDATVFSIDVAVAKARNTAYYNDPAQLLAVDQAPGVPAGVALTARTFRFLSLPRFPEGIDGEPPGPFSILNDPGIDPRTGLNLGAPQPASAYQSVFGFDSFNPGTNFRDPAPTPQNGVVFFPGSSGVYKNLPGGRQIVGGFGVSGDGVDQDDVVTFFGISGFDAPAHLRADMFFVNGVRLPYLKFPRNPEG